MSAEEKPKDYSESPINLEYFYTAGSATTRFLNQVKEGNIVGQGCPKCKAVYVPKRELSKMWSCNRHRGSTD